MSSRELAYPNPPLVATEARTVSEMRRETEKRMAIMADRTFCPRMIAAGSLCYVVGTGLYLAQCICLEGKNIS